MATVSSLRSYFSWLSPAFRPSSKEVEAYARLIFAHEGCSAEDFAEYKRQAELQLWVWRNENRHRAPVRSRQRALESTLASAS